LKAYHEIFAKTANMEMPDLARSEIDAKLDELKKGLARFGATV
jgi:hypothetical protein